MGWGKNSWNNDFSKKYRFNTPRINKSAIILLILIAAIAVLSFFTYTTGSYVNVLESNKTVLQKQLKDYMNQTQCLASNLSACTINLKSCNDALTSKSTSFLQCDSEKSSLSNSLNICNDDLNSCENSRNVYSSDLDACNDDINSCNDAKITLRNNYARDYCCLLNKTHYTISDNRITCSDSGAAISC